jgi:hypothetical protein
MSDTQSCFAHLDQDIKLAVAKAAAAQSMKLHGPGHSHDFVFGYWKCCADLAAACGFRIERSSGAER